MHDQRRCYLIGKTTLLIKCCESLLKRDYQILGVITQDQEIISWLDSKKIIHINDLNEIKEPYNSFEYLFSIINDIILPQKLIRQAKRLAINYHDAPLPKYAGVNSTTWAIINQETTHGITFHLMTDKVDQGDIVKQTQFIIKASDTALSLNLKAYEKAQSAFDSLLDDIENNNVKFIKQNIQERTYYGKNHILPNNGFIDWNTTCKDINRLFLATYFGNYANPVGLPKIIIKSKVFIVSKFEIQKTSFRNKNGTIIDVYKNSISVVAKNGVIKIKNICTLAGVEISISEIVKSLDIRVGDNIHPDKKTIDGLVSLFKKARINESYWVDKIQQLNIFKGIANAGHLNHQVTNFTVTDTIEKLSKKLGVESHILLLTMILLYIYRLNNGEPFSYASPVKKLEKLSNLTKQIFSQNIYHQVDFSDCGLFADAVYKVNLNQQDIKNKFTFFNDLSFRYKNINIFSDANALKIEVKAKEISVENHLSYFNIHRGVLHFIKVVSKNLDKQVNYLPLVNRFDSNNILKKWNNTQTHYNFSASLSAEFERQVDDTPMSIAIKYYDKSLTYFELNQKANQLAYHLVKNGFGSNDFICIYMERSIEMVVAILGILKAGGAYIPIDVTLPEKRICAILEDCQSKTILTHDKVIDNIHKIPGAINCINLDNDSIFQLHPTKNLPERSNLGHPAYVIYTSGSTGAPKGVVIEHKAILNRLYWMQQKYQLDSSDVVLQKTPYSFDVSVWEFFWPLITGAKLVIAAVDGHKDSDYLMGLIERDKITTLHFIPSMLNIFLQNNRALYDHCLKRVFCSGEALTYTAVEKFNKKFPNVKLHNLYGPTEAAVDVSYFNCNEVKEDNLVPIGKPIANIKLYILDKNNQLLPPLIPGELHIGGIGLARGYLNRPELTQEKFINDSFAGNKKSRLYKTGDLAYFLPDGNIAYLGRIDNQVKINGIRIELGEIESMVRAYHAVSDVAVIVDADRIIAYIIPQKKDALKAEELKKYLMEYLPTHMIPNSFIMLETFPLTANGKLNRNALSALNIVKNTENNYQSPKTALEEQLVTIWQEVLSVEKIGTTDNFFDLGGNSLSAMRLNVRLNDIMGKNIKLSDIFSHSTVLQQAKLLNNIQDLLITSNVNQKITEEKSSGPLSFQQQRLWFLQRFYPNLKAYCLQMLFNLKGHVNIELLELSLKKLLERQTVLRTTFHENNDNIMQVINSVPDQILQILDYSNEISISTDKISRFVEKIENTPFDLERGPLFKAYLIKVDKSHYYLLFSLHHIIADGWSLGLIKQELTKLYNKNTNHKEVIIDHLPIQYIDYSTAQRLQSGQSRSMQALEYWCTKLSGDLPLLQLPFDYERPTTQEFTGKTFDFAVPVETAQKVNTLVKTNKNTIFTVMLTAFYVLLYRYTQQADIIIGTAVANRLATNIEKLIGFFANTLVLRTNLFGNPTFRSLLKNVQDVVLDALTYQEVPFEHLLEKLNIPRDLQHNPIFQVMFVLQNTYSQVLAPTDITVEEINYHPTTSKFDLTLFVKEQNNELLCQFEYNDNLFKSETIQQLSVHFNKVLELLVTNLDQTIDNFSILTVGEQHKFLNWNNTNYLFADYDKCLHELFEKQAAIKPNTIALVTNKKRFTYGDIELASNRIGNHLYQLGVKPNQLVAIVMERGWEQIMAVLGILKSGAAYLPIIASDPQARIDNLLSQGEVKIVLTQARWKSKIVWPPHIRVLAVDDENEWRSIPSTKLPVLQKTTDLAYVIFTSGSTGIPKGVMIDHRGAVNTILDINERFSVQEKDCVFGVSALNFDLSVYDIFGAFAAGARLVLPAAGSDKEPDEWIKLIRLEAITIWNSVPTLMQMLVEKFVSKQPDEEIKKQLAKMRVVLLSGDWIPLSLPEKIKQCIGNNVQAISLGGATEGSIWSIIHSINTMQPTWKSIPYGQPMRNQRFYSLNAGLQQVPVGVIGELHIGGIGVARGYWKDPVRSNNSFIRHPVTQEFLYKTGDLGRYLSDGTIEFIGRIDNQVKIRGFRIELGEIESRLIERSDIEQAVVMSIGDIADEKILVAYITSTSENDLDINQLKIYLKQILPSYMVPHTIVQLPTFPLTANGKVDRRALPLPNFNIDDAIKYVPPQTPLQRDLAKIWQKLLNNKKISLHSDFFVLGGHSLLATRLAIKIRDEFNIEIPLKIIFEYSTLSSFAEYLSLIMLTPTVKFNDLVAHQTIEEGTI